MIEVWNKIDRLSAADRERLTNLAARHEAKQRPVPVSAITGEGVDQLTDAIEARIALSRTVLELEVDGGDGAGISWLHRNTEVLLRTDRDDGKVVMTVRADPTKVDAVRREVSRGVARDRPTRARLFSAALAASQSASISARSDCSGVLPRAASALSIDANRRSNFRLAPRSVASGSASRCRARLATANSRSPTSAAAPSRVAGLDVGLDLVGLFADLGQHRQRIVPVESDLAGLLLELERARQGREPDRNAGERAALRARRLRRLLLVLDLLPEPFDRLGREPALIAEHVRMPAQELLGDRLDHAAEIERALLLGHAGVERDLQQEVAQLFAQVVEIAARNRVGDLVGFLERVGRDGREILLEVPRAAGAGRAQRRHDLQEPADIAGRGHGRGVMRSALLLPGIPTRPLPHASTAGQSPAGGYVTNRR